MSLVTKTPSCTVKGKQITSGTSRSWYLTRSLPLLFSTIYGGIIQKCLPWCLWSLVHTGGLNSPSNLELGLQITSLWLEDNWIYSPKASFSSYSLTLWLTRTFPFAVDLESAAKLSHRGGLEAFKESHAQPQRRTAWGDLVGWADDIEERHSNKLNKIKFKYHTISTNKTDVHLGGYSVETKIHIFMLVTNREGSLR